MQIGPDSFYKCPDCGKILRNRSLLSGNTTGSAFFSNGSRRTLLLPGNEMKKEISARLAEKIEQDATLAKNALEFYKKMAANCHAEAQYLLGNLYLSERFYNLSEAVRWFEYAAFQGHKGAIAEIQSLGEEEDGRYDAWV